MESAIFSLSFTNNPVLWKTTQRERRTRLNHLVSGFTQHLASFSLNRITSRCSIISRGLSPPLAAHPFSVLAAPGHLNHPSISLPQLPISRWPPVYTFFFLSDVVKKTSSFRDVLSVICSFWGNSSVGAARTSAICFQRVGFFFDCTDLSHFHSNVGIFFKFCLFFYFCK